MKDKWTTLRLYTGSDIEYYIYNFKQKKLKLRVTSLIYTRHKSKEILLLGDFNAPIGNDAIDGIKCHFNEDTSNENGDFLI